MLGTFGLPIRDETILAFTGFAVCKNYCHTVPVLAAAYLGSIFGITLNYLVGCGFGQGLFRAGLLPGAQDPAFVSQSRGSVPGSGCAASTDAPAALGQAFRLPPLIRPA
jgi:hypothetical protein